MQRRSFLKGVGALPLIAYMPKWANARSMSGKTLILVELGGGNDSLNSFVPYANSAYYSAREDLAVDAESILPLTSDLGLNPVMSALLPIWEQGEMALVQGLGYPVPNRSHFRSIEIWQTASDSDEFLYNGWLTELLGQEQEELEAIILGGANGPVRGEDDQFLLGSSRIINRQSEVLVPVGSSDNPAVNFIVEQRQQYNGALASIQAALNEAPNFTTTFPGSSFGQQCQQTAQLLAGGLEPCILHLGLGSFDTHSNQRNNHDTLLQDLADGLAALRTELTAQGLWSDMVIATYSEFGRRVAENASSGTDHGTAATHLVMGGNVSGGLYGTMPSLTDLDEEDLIYTTDFRSYYRTLSDWMEWQPSQQIQDYENLTFV